MLINGIRFDMDWRQGASPREMLPKRYGIYCNVVWPVRGIRIGIAKNIWARHGGHASWMRSMRKGVSARSTLQLPISLVRRIDSPISLGLARATPIMIRHVAPNE